MKISLRSIRLFQPAKLTALAIVILCGISVSPARADYIISLQQVGPDVVATGTGTIDLTGLSFGFGGGSNSGFIDPAFSLLVVGAYGPSDQYQTNSFTGPSNFGSDNGGVFGDFISGVVAGVFVPGDLFIYVPQGYVSGTPLSLGSSTWSGQTFSSLDVTPGIYEWTWGAGVNQNFTLYAGVPVPAVPDSGSTLGLLILSLAGLFGAARFRSLRLA